MDSFPAYFPLAGRRVVIVGSGEQAEAKARLFDGSPAELVRLDEDGRALDPESYQGAVLAFIASDDEAFARMAATRPEPSGTLVSMACFSTWASTGDEPPVPTAATTSPRSTRAGVKKSQSSGRSTTLTGAPASLAAAAAMRAKASSSEAMKASTAP